MDILLTIFITCFLYWPSVSLQSNDDQLQRLQDLESKQRTYEEKLHKQQLIIESLQKTVSRIENLHQPTYSSTTSKQPTNRTNASILDDRRGVDQVLPRSSQNTNDKGRKYGRQVVIQDHPKIAFTAFLDHSVSLGRLQTVVFNKVVTNEGGAFNVFTGVFTCPFAGMYLFSFSVSSRNPEQIWTHLVVNDQIKIDAVANSFHDMQDMQGSNTVLLRLNAGDAVWIKTFNDNYHIEIPYDGRFNSFTGVLLYT